MYVEPEPQDLWWGDKEYPPSAVLGIGRDVPSLVYGISSGLVLFIGLGMAHIGQMPPRDLIDPYAPGMLAPRVHLAGWHARRIARIAYPGIADLHPVREQHDELNLHKCTDCVPKEAALTNDERLAATRHKDLANRPGTTPEQLTRAVTEPEVVPQPRATPANAVAPTPRQS